MPHLFGTPTVVGGILLSADQELGVEQLAVGSRSNFVNGLRREVSRGRPKLLGVAYRRVQIDEDGTRNVFSASGFSEKGLVGATFRRVRIRVGTSIGLETVLKQVAVAGVLVRGFGASERESYSSQALLPS
jgi:hypothetical protein